MRLLIGRKYLFGDYLAGDWSRVIIIGISKFSLALFKVLGGLLILFNSF